MPPTSPGQHLHVGLLTPPGRAAGRLGSPDPGSEVAGGAPAPESPRESPRAPAVGNR